MNLKKRNEKYNQLGDDFVIIISVHKLREAKQSAVYAPEAKA